jgi:hypothetical protein
VPDCGLGGLIVVSSVVVRDEGNHAVVAALVTFAAPHGTVKYTMGSETAELGFGRHGDCPIRIGHAPTLDDCVPRRAGRLMLVGARVAVENLDDVYAFDLAVRNGPRTTVRPGEMFSPAGRAFEVVLAGKWTYAIRVATAPVPVRPAVVAVNGEPGPLTIAPPMLDSDERAVLDAYLAPLRSGHPLHATHVEVADTLGRSKTWVRNKAADIYEKFFLAPVPMRDWPDQVDAIVDAAWRHGL